jgi:hypothetical protein
MQNIMTAAPMDSCVVPHRSTNRAVLWLTAQIGRDAVLSESYGRRHLLGHVRAWQGKEKKKKKISWPAERATPPHRDPRPHDAAVPELKMTGPEVPERAVQQQVEQICRTRAKPQQIVATRLLYCLQYPVPIQVVCKGFTPAHMMVAIRGRTPEAFPPRGPSPPDSVREPEGSILTRLTRAGPTSSFPARVLA